MRVTMMCVLVVVLALPQPTSAQETALRRTELTNDLLTLRELGPDIVADVFQLAEVGPAVQAFLLTPRAANAPSIAVLELIIEEVHKAAPSAALGGDLFGTAHLSAVGGPASAAAGLPATGLILQATAEFLAGRVKDELAMEYVDLLIGLVDEPVVDDLTLYSRQALNLAGETHYRTVLPLLRESVKRDFKLLPLRLTTEATYDQSNIDPDRSALSLAALGVRITGDLFASQPVLDVLGDLRTLRPLGSSAIAPDSGFVGNEAVRQALIITGVIAREYKLHADEAHSILAAHDSSAIYFAAFLAQEVSDTTAFPGITTRESVVAGIERSASLLTDAVAQLDELQDLVSTAHRAGAGQSATDAYLDVISRTMDLVALGSEILPGAEPLPFQTFGVVVRQVADGYVAMASGNYRGLVIEMLAATWALDLELLPPAAQRYLLFAASLADATTTEEMVAAIETTALPPGGYRTKRGHSAVGITAYGGGAGYLERTDSDGEAFAGGPAFPIAAEFSFPFEIGGGRTRWRTSASFLMTVIDVGNLVSLRDGEDSPDPELAQVFAPGVGFQLGFGADNPWCIGFLAQRVRNLRQNGSESVVRYGAFVGIDMPLLRLWSK